MESSQKGSGVLVLPLAVAVGIVYGVSIMWCAAVAVYTTSYAHKMVEVFASVYPGYGPSWGGAFIGLAWGVADGFVTTLIFVGVYCLLARCCRLGKSSTEEASQ